MRLEIALPTAAAADSSDAPAAPAASATSGASRAAGVLIALADCVRLAALPSLEPLTCLPRTAGATSLAWDAEGGVLCVAIKRRVLVLRFDGRSTFKEEREFTCPDAPRLLALPSPTTLCAATPTKYLLHHIPPPGTAGSGGSWRDMLPCGQVAPPSVVKLPRGEMLVGKDSIGLFLDASGRPLRSHGINWSRPPSHVAVMPPYALAKLPNYIEVRSLLPGHALVQTIPLREHAALWTPPNLPTATTGAVEGSSRGAGRSARGVFAVAEESVYIVAPVSLAAQIDQLVSEGLFEEALSLCEGLEDGEGEEEEGAREGEEERSGHPRRRMDLVRLRLAHHLFSSGEFDRAMQQLALCSLPPLLPALSLFPFLPSLPSSILSLATASSPYPPSFPSASPSSPSYPLSPSSTPSAAATPLGVQSQSDLTGRQRKLALLSLVVFLAEKRAAAVAAAAAATSSSAPAAAPASATAAADSLEKEGEENEGEEQQSIRISSSSRHSS
ncbi:unnamed protein product [Closterium sp. NIES-53]